MVSRETAPLPNGSLCVCAASSRTNLPRSLVDNPYPRPGRSTDTGTTRSLAPALGALLLHDTSRFSSPIVVPSPKPLPGRRPGEDHLSAVRCQGRFVLQRPRRRRPPGASSETALAATATRSGVTAPTSPAAPKRNRDHRPSRRHRGQHVAPGAPRPVRDRHVHPSSDCHTDKPGPDRLQSLRCTAQPTPHCRRRHPQTRCDPPMPRPLRTGINAAQRRSAAYALRNNMVAGNNTWSPRTLGNAPAAAAPDRPAQRSFAHGRDPTRPAPRRNLGTQSPQQPTATRRGQDQPLPSPPVPPSTTARHPAVPAKTPRGVAHPTSSSSH